MALVHFSENGFQKALHSGSLMLVDFWADWCSPCKRLGPVIEDLANDYEGKNVVIGKANVEELPALAQQYGVMNIPTVIFFQNGREIDRKVGLMTPDVYQEVLDAKL